MTDKWIPSKKDIKSYLEDRRNWGRWGEHGSLGAINLIDNNKRIQAAELVKTGRSISLSRPLPVQYSLENPQPAQHYLQIWDKPPNGGAAVDYYGVMYHGTATTHIDALCHVWDENGMWDGRDPSETITFSGAKYGSIDAWHEGIMTRGILLDVPRYRKNPYVTLDEPVHGWELEQICKQQGVKLEPGDAVFVYSGREAYARSNGEIWSDRIHNGARPGLHASCLPFIRDHDVSILGWDMMDAAPNEYNIPWTMHGVIFAYGVALLDNSLLEPLSKACKQEKRYEFMITINPLNVIGGTGSPVNPIATF